MIVESEYLCAFAERNGKECEFKNHPVTKDQP